MTSSKQQIQMNLADDGFPGNISNLERPIKKTGHVIAGNFECRMDIAVLLFSGFQLIQAQKNCADQGGCLKWSIDSVQFRKALEPLAEKSVITRAHFSGLMPWTYIGFEYRIDGLTIFQVGTFMSPVRGDQEGVVRKSIEFLSCGNVDSALSGNKIEQFPAKEGMSSCFTKLLITSYIRKCNISHKKTCIFH